jgi:hypothetical protein
MNIDFNALCIVTLAAFTAYFGMSFFRMLFRERKKEIVDRINEVEDHHFREIDKIYTRMNALERICHENECCRAEKYPVKNHYNTGA